MRSQDGGAISGHFEKHGNDQVLSRLALGRTIEHVLWLNTSSLELGLTIPIFKRPVKISGNNGADFG